MGMFDSVFGDVICFSCSTRHKVEIQFKFGENMLTHYYIGDDIPACTQLYHLIRADYATCPACQNTLYANAVVRNGRVIAILNDMQVISCNLSELPDVEPLHGRKQAYEKHIQSGVGEACEYAPFEEHPKSVGESITALSTNWRIQARWKKMFKPNTSSLQRIMGSMGRRSPNWFLYRVTHPTFGERYLEITDAHPALSPEILENMALFLIEDYTFQDKFQYDSLDG